MASFARLPRDAVRVSGPDAVAYLQGQLSQDVEPMGVGTTVWTLALHPQGKVAAWFRLTRTAADAFLADIDAGFGAALVERLSRFRLRTKVDLEALEGWSMLAVREAVTLPAWPADVWVLPFEWNGWVGHDVIGPEPAVGVAAAGLVSAGVSDAGRPWYDAGRVAARFPALGAEIDDDTIPAEVGVVEESVSFTKGCYVGQELVARIDSRGAQTPRKLRLVELDGGDGEAPARGAELIVDGAVVGRLTTVATDPATGATSALALVKRAVEPPTEAHAAGRPATILP